MYSSVIPGAALSGHVAAQVQFPAWLGKNSRHNKMKRLAHEIHAHTRLSATASKSSIFLDYARALRDSIVTPLVQDKAEGIPAAIDLLTSYHLTREDLDSLAELATWPGQRDPMVLVDSKRYRGLTADSVVTPLVQDKAEGIPAAIDLLTCYHLTREDLDSLAELATWPGQRDPMVLVDSKDKAEGISA
ncbi:hypothetical protein JYU34_011178 [Plutella xylostella]|uniref:DNA replication factor RFC1 C-terminal domain-containing protein n=1 Tax=Plutella xylostella TaxID=51655 RepID=A0ABQ7QGA1_PLUXY|nr:hypothetical protein JYU34_011178 [Plutella xylostella]